MNVLDVLIIAGLVISALHGFRLGLVRQFSATLGFVGGLFAGAYIQTKLVHLAHTPSTRAALSLVVIWSVAALFLTLGEWIGWLIKSRITIGLLNKIDRELGSVISAATLLIVVWLGAAAFATMPIHALAQQIKTSKIIGVMNERLPATPTVIAKIGRLIEPNGFPQVFAGNEPSTNTNVSLPPSSDLAGAVGLDQASVVKIEGEGCGGIVEGSGFVARNGLVATNAHVVAGVRRPVVLDENGEHNAQVVWFDADLDFAVLRVNGLAGKPLILDATTQPTGTPAAVLGYPGGGNFTAGPAAILDFFQAVGRNIYNQGQTNRSVYSVKADVQPGNSGGPLVSKTGAVIGIVFAQSTTYQDVGYALTMSPVVHELNQAQGSTQSVDTGTCAE